MLLRKLARKNPFEGGSAGMLRTIALLLFTVCVLISCGKGHNPDPTDPVSAEETEPSETTPPADAKWYLMRTEWERGFTEYSYNELGQKIGISNYVNGNPYVAATYEYDDLGRVVVELSTSVLEGAISVMYSYEGENPVFTTRESDNGSVKLITHQGFDDEMRLIHSETRNGDEVVSRYTYQYLDEHGSYEQYDMNQSLYIKRLYDENGNLLEEFVYSEGECHSHVVYEFNEQNQKIRQTSYDGGSDLVTFLAEYEYDESGLLVKDTFYSGSGDVQLKKQYIYDEYHNLIQMETSNASGELMEVMTYTYSTDPVSFYSGVTEG